MHRSSLVKTWHIDSKTRLSDLWISIFTPAYRFVSFLWLEHNLCTMNTKCNLMIVYQTGNLQQTYQIPGRMQFLFDAATLKGGMMLNTGGSVASEWSWDRLTWIPNTWKGALTEWVILIFFPPLMQFSSLSDAKKTPAFYNFFTLTAANVTRYVSKNPATCFQKILPIIKR